MFSLSTLGIAIGGALLWMSHNAPKPDTIEDAVTTIRMERLLGTYDAGIKVKDTECNQMFCPHRDNRDGKCKKKYDEYCGYEGVRA